MTTATTPSPRFDPYLLTDRHRYQSLQMQFSGVTMVVDAEGVIRHVSPAASRIFAIGNRTAEGESLLSVVHRQDVLSTLVNLDKTRRATDTTVSWVSRLRTRDRWEWYKVSATSFRYDRGHHPVAVLFLQPLGDT